jgi:hypothetical protein
MKLKWEEPAEPVKIAGPLYFVGTKGLGVFLFVTPECHILMNTGMPSSGPMIVGSIKRTACCLQRASLRSASLSALTSEHGHRLRAQKPVLNTRQGPK